MSAAGPSVVQPSSSSSKGILPRSGWSVLLLLLGLMALVFWMLVMLVRIQTSEAFLLAGSKVGFIPNWGVLLQPLELFQGTVPTSNGGTVPLSPIMSEAIIWGWGLELIVLIYTVCYEAVKHTFAKRNKGLMKWFHTGAILLFIIDACADYQYGSLPSGMWGQVGFALVCAFIIVFFGMIGVFLIECAIQEW